VAAREILFEALERASAERQSRMLVLEGTLRSNNERAATLERELAIRAARIEALTEGLKRRETEFHRLRQLLNTLYASTSWRLTAPLRSAASALTVSQRNTLRRIAKLGYWIVTPHRIPGRVRFIRARNRDALERTLTPASARGTPPITSAAKDAEPQAANDASVDRSDRISILEGAVARRDERIVALESEHVRRDAQITALEGMITSGRERIAALERLNTERLSALEAMLGSRDERLMALESERVTHDARVAALERFYGERISALEGMLGARDRDLESRDAQIDALENAAADHDGSQGEARSWFFLGDTIDWLQAYDRVSGVGRVTCELFFASLRAGDESRFIPCVRGAARSGLVSIPYSDTAAYLTDRLGAGGAGIKPNSGALPAPVKATYPRKGDHVLFTGVIWNQDYIDLFVRLTKNGVSLSVLVYDIIPINRPDLVTEDYRIMFSEWLRATIALARVIYVCSSIIKDEIVRWAVLEGRELDAEIVVLEFGSSDVTALVSGDELRADPQTSSVDLRGFVLSVGTIDRRKNQLFLCRLWSRLVSELGRDNVPQLVLAGRDDLGIRNLAEFSEPFKDGKIVILEGIADAQLFALYQACLFTVLPSLSEGYGLPVAESLLSGKLCISADLPVIRTHARDLAWYFDSTDAEAAFALLRTAIESPDKRAEAEKRIRKQYKATSWSSTLQTIAAAIRSSNRERSNGTAIPTGVPAPEFLEPISPATALRRIQTWCTSNSPDVSIVITNLNTSAMTLECVRQIWANTEGISYEIVIVDNGSDPNNLATLRILGQSEGVRLLELGCNRFFGEANNIAVERAAGRYVCLLSSDTFAQPNWLRSLVDCFEETQEAGAVGPLFLRPDKSIQEAGRSVDQHGFCVPLGHGESSNRNEYRTGKSVDYIPADALLLNRETYTDVGGFDFAYEPASYEDMDLCFKLQAIGKKVLLCPAAVVVRGPDAALDDPKEDQRKQGLYDVNREKFVARWCEYLRTRAPEAARKVASNFIRDRELPATTVRSRTKPTAAIFTPFVITPGGGERYILTLAWALTKEFSVTVVTPYPYSRLRLRQIGIEFDIDLSVCDVMTTHEFQLLPQFDFMVAMGNHIVPSTQLLAGRGAYMCQFPFRLSSEITAAEKASLGDYATIIVNSEYTKACAYNALSVHQMPALPIQIVYPPVPQLGGDARKKKNSILAVGRFFVGAHSKRHDLMIEAFRSLSNDGSLGDIELHLAGSSVPNPEQMAYLNGLKAMADGLKVFFHVNVPSPQLHQLYRDAAVYWHATGLGADLDRYPEKAEHFGISLVEAMSAECAPLAFNAGGPREIIQHSVDGLLYSSVDELVEMTRTLLDPENKPRRVALGRSAGRRAAAFSVDRFVDEVRKMATTIVSGNKRRGGASDPRHRGPQLDAALRSD